MRGLTANQFRAWGTCRAGLGGAVRSVDFGALVSRAIHSRHACAVWPLLRPLPALHVLGLHSDLDSAASPPPCGFLRGRPFVSSGVSGLLPGFRFHCPVLDFGRTFVRRPVGPPAGLSLPAQVIYNIVPKLSITILIKV